MTRPGVSSISLSLVALPLRPLALAYRVVAVLLIALGVNNLIDPFTANPNWISLLYFTALSNLLALAWMIVVTVATARDLVKRGARGVTNPSPEFHGAVMMTVTVTLLVYTIVLAPTSDSGYVPYTWDDSLMHVIMPVLVIVDWLVFTPKGRMRWVDPLLWALIPASYLVFSFTFSAFGGDFGLGRRYPYPLHESRHPGSRWRGAVDRRARRGPCVGRVRLRRDRHGARPLGLRPRHG